ncbi:hypothetical protein [Youngiibacter multivorans]|uniref:Type II secretion system protein n=1 Tax=Youngiibacter multivorans TaxID=937251 RepID=A0ABS4G6K8_9CLOT|nr:hypothetical protein [Youngiibacter multivorans]MBP1920087.1 hypothetical protein [Youngiibacter multivorans]
MRNHDKFRNTGYGHKVRKGYISILATFAVLAVFIALQSIISESMDSRLKLIRYKEQLAFDYRVEAYYLMIREGNLDVPEGEAFGSLNSYSLESASSGDTWISIVTVGGVTSINGYLDKDRRGTYEIRD